MSKFMCGQEKMVLLKVKHVLAIIMMEVRIVAREPMRLIQLIKPEEESVQF